MTGKLLTLDRALEPLSAGAALRCSTFRSTIRQWQALDPPQRRQRTLDARQAPAAPREPGPALLVVFEDLHWIDAETQACSTAWSRACRRPGSCSSSTTGPSTSTPGAARPTTPSSGSIRCHPRAPTSCSRPCSARIRRSSPLKRALDRADRGNPFFLEESVRTLVETRVLVGERGAYRLAQDTGRDARSRPRSRRSSRRASTGCRPRTSGCSRPPPSSARTCRSRCSQAIAEVPEDTLRRALAHLQAAEFLYETSLFPDLEYTFKHALTHEVAYGGLLQDRRRTLHARIVGAIETLYPDRLAEHVERLAHHAVRGRAWNQAVTFLRQAGAKAFARSANRDAVAHYEEALGVQQHLPQSRTRDEDAIDLRFELRSALMVLGDFPRTLTVLREAQDLAKALGDTRRLGWAAGYLSNLLWEMGEQDEAIGHGQEALDIAARLDDTALKYLALRYLGRCYHAIGQYRQGVEMFHRALTSVEPARSTAPPGRPNPSVNSSRHFAALCLMELGAFPEAIEYAETALSAVEGVDQAFNLAGSCAVLGYVHLRRGDVRKAIPLLERGVELCRSGNLPVLFPFAASPLGAAYALSNRIAEALQLLEHAVNQAASMRRMVDLSLHVAWQSEVLLQADRTDDAKESAPARPGVGPCPQGTRIPGVDFAITRRDSVQRRASPV